MARIPSKSSDARPTIPSKKDASAAPPPPVASASIDDGRIKFKGGAPGSAKRALFDKSNKNDAQNAATRNARERKKRDKKALSEHEQVKKLSVIVAVSVLVMIISLGFAVSMYITTRADQISMSANTSKVYVANTEIKAGQAITQDVVTLEDVPSRYLSEGATGDINAIIGRVAITTIYRHGQITQAMLFGQGNLSSLATAIPANSYAVTIGVGSASGLSGMLKQGDRVDLYMVTGDEGGIVGVEVIMSNVQIVALDSALADASVSAYSTITLALESAADVERVLLAQTRGSITCVLHATDVNSIISADKENSQGQGSATGTAVTTPSQSSSSSSSASSGTSRQSSSSSSTATSSSAANTNYTYVDESSSTSGEGGDTGVAGTKPAQGTGN